MARVTIPVEFLGVSYQTGPQRIQVNISREFKQIVFFLADYGSIAILKKVAPSPMPFIETNNISG